MVSTMYCMRACCYYYYPDDEASTLQAASYAGGE